MYNNGCETVVWHFCHAKLPFSPLNQFKKNKDKSIEENKMKRSFKILALAFMLALLCAAVVYGAIVSYPHNNVG